MTHPLAGCWAKIERAKELIIDLDSAIKMLLDSGAYLIAGECQPEQSRYVFKLMGPPVPLRIAVTAGEVIHQLRACFDHVVWALASKNGLPDTDRIAFPVCSTSEKYDATVKNGILRGVSASDRLLIEALQPYHVADPPNCILQLLHRLDIEDKHRLLVVVSHTLVMGNSITITRNDNPGPGFGIELPSTVTMRYPWAIEDGVETHWIPLRGTPGPEFRMEVDSRPEIAFEQIGTIQRAPVIPILRQFLAWTQETLPQFNKCWD
jgi:hypothetical protein